MRTHLNAALRKHWSGDPYPAANRQTGKIMRQAGGRVTLKFSIANQDYYLKRHQSTVWRIILRKFFLGRIAVAEMAAELDALLKLDRIGISAPVPVGWGWGTNGSFIVTQGLSDSVSLESHVAGWKEDKPELRHRKALLENVAELTRTLHACGINHRDLYLCHYYLRHDSAKNQPALHILDLHRAQLRAYVPDNQRIKDLGALLSSAHHLFLTEREQLRFIRHYHKIPLNTLSLRQWQLWAKVLKRAQKIWVRNIYKQTLPQGATGPMGLEKIALWTAQDMLACIQDLMAFPATYFAWQICISGARRLHFRIEKVLSYQPRHHITLKASWRGQAVVLKIFYLDNARSKRRWKRTLRGSKLLKCAGIATPSLIDQWQEVGGQLGIVAFQYLEQLRCVDTGDFGHVWQLLRTMNKHGLVHVDAHLGNFIWAGNKLHVTDTDGVRPIRLAKTRRYHMVRAFVRCIPLHMQLRLAKRYRMDQKTIVRILRKRALSVHSKWRYRKDKDFYYMRHRKHSVLIRRAHMSPELLAWLKSMRWKHSASSLKTGSRSVVSRIKYQNTDLVCKYYFPRGFCYTLGHLGNPGAAWRSWTNANRLLRYTDVRTPTPIALIEKGWLFWKHQWAISEYCAGTRLDQLAPTQLLSKKIDGEIQRFFTTLDLLELRHGDTKASNFIISKDSLYVLDLDGMRVRSSLWGQERDRDRKRFLHNFATGSAQYRHYSQLLSK
jgi:heptose I phosphotransferase